MIQEAVEFHRDSMRKGGCPISEPTTLCEYVEVASPVPVQLRS